jgi:hypothetical protein
MLLNSLRAFLLVLLVPVGAQGQLLDSIRYFLKQDRQFVAKLDGRGSFVRNENVRIFGVKAGFEHGGRFQYGIGWSMLLTPVERTHVQEGRSQETRLRMWYFNPYVDYAFYQRGRWEIRLPVQIGFGRGTLSSRYLAGPRLPLRRTGLILYEPAMTVQYRFLRYLAVSGGWGFRLAIHTRSGLGENLTAPIYTFGLRVFFGDLWNDIGGHFKGRNDRD